MLQQGRTLLCLAMTVCMAFVGGCQAESGVQADSHSASVRVDQAPLVRPFPLVLPRCKIMSSRSTYWKRLLTGDYLLPARS